MNNYYYICAKQEFLNQGELEIRQPFPIPLCVKSKTVLFSSLPAFNKSGLKKINSLKNKPLNFGIAENHTLVCYKKEIVIAIKSHARRFNDQ